MAYVYRAAVAVLIALSTLGSAALAETVPVTGQVTKIDVPARKITIKHEPIPNLDMDRMTMVFRVKDPAMLSAVKVGETITFEADRVDGALTVVSLHPKR